MGLPRLFRAADARRDVARGGRLVGERADGEDAEGHRGEHAQRHLHLLGRHRRRRRRTGRSGSFIFPGGSTRAKKGDTNPRHQKVAHVIQYLILF